MARDLAVSTATLRNVSLGRPLEACLDGIRGALGSPTGFRRSFGSTCGVFGSRDLKALLRK